jgi:N-acyl-D-aspartate/D-glutamate deacylase/CubicO group peptidase (beta-lactamase class C family)
MQKIIVLFLGMALFINGSTQAQQHSIQQLDAVLSNLYNTDRFNGTVLFAENGKIVYQKAFGIADLSAKPLQINAAFNLASISKQFVAMGILKLLERKKLQLDDPVRKFIPALPYDSISIRNLLTHTSGIPEYFETFQQYRGTLDTLNNEGLIQLFAKHKPGLEFSPGSQWKYCNTNYVLLAAIIERIAHQSFPDFFQQEIAKPLGLKNTYAYHLLLSSIPDNHVYGFTHQNESKKLFDLTNMDGVTGDGNVYSSAEDLFHWEQDLYHSQLVSAHTLNQAFQPVMLTNGQHYPYGFGWFIQKEKESYWHTGGWQGFRNLICRNTKDKTCLVVLSSGDCSEAAQEAKKWFDGSVPQALPTQLITNALLIDGTGIPGRKAAVRIEGNKILAVGNLKPFGGETVVDAGGMVLAPGFIDSHSHIGGSLQQHPDALACISQGVTSIVSGQDGEGYAIDSILTQIKQHPIAINIATYTGQTDLRRQVMGATNLGRPATQTEMEAMKKLLSSEMQKGSLGLSTGLEYEGAYFSTREEVLQLATLTAGFKGRYISHIRSEDINFSEALDEIINIGRVAKLPVQVSHIKIGLKDDWGSAPNILALLEKARMDGVDITADCYPYDYWHSTLKVLFPKTDYTNPVSAAFAVEHSFDPSQSVLVNFAANPSYAGRTISDIAAMRNEKPAQTIMGLIAEADAFEKQHPDATAIEDIMGKSMTEEDVINFLAWSHTNFCSDGSNGGHPRGYGSFTRILGRYVRDKKIMSLETAIQKMTSLSAEHTGIHNRGIIAAGYYADLVLFDPQTIQDNAGIKNSTAISTGIHKVWVNGVCVFENQQPTKKYPGTFLSRLP